ALAAASDRILLRPLLPVRKGHSEQPDALRRSQAPALPCGTLPGADSRSVLYLNPFWRSAPPPNAGCGYASRRSLCRYFQGACQMDSLSPNALPRTGPIPYCSRGVRGIRSERPLFRGRKPTEAPDRNGIWNISAFVQG